MGPRARPMEGHRTRNVRVASVGPQPPMRLSWEGRPPYGVAINPGFDDTEPQARFLGHHDRTIGIQSHWGVDEIFMEVPVAGREVGWQHEVWEGGECEVRGTADAGLQQSSTPDRDLGFLAEVVGGCAGG